MTYTTNIQMSAAGCQTLPLYTLYVLCAPTKHKTVTLFDVFTWTGGGKCAPYYSAEKTQGCKHRESTGLTFNTEFCMNHHQHSPMLI